MDVFKLKNVDLINKDYLEAMKDLKQDVVFIDAPWGGDHKQKKYKFIRLNLSGKPLSQVINDLEGKAKHVVFKAPGNFDFGDFMKNIKYPNVDVKNIPDRHWKIIVVHK